MKNYFVLFVITLLLTVCCLSAAENKPLNNTTLWYEQPADNWNDGLPVGNGQIGAMILGSVGRERIALNHNRLWREIKNRGHKNPKMGHLRADIQNLYFEGKIDEAVSATHIVNKPWPDAYQPFGDFYINFPGHEMANIKDYRSELDLATGIAKVSYAHDGITYVRQTFASRVDDVIVVRLSADKKGSITADLNFSRKDDPDCTLTGWADGNRIGFKGEFVEGVRFAGATQVFNKAGQLLIADKNASQITVKNSDEVLILIALATDKETDDCVEWGLRHLDKFNKKANFSKLAKRHIAKHGELFGRMDISFGGGSKRNLATDERLALLVAGQADPDLFALQFQFNRYVLISSSRPGSLPSNLQFWNQDLRPMWNSDYHTDANIQMNYWPAEVTNLSELHEPVFSFVENLLPHARQAAKDLFGCRGIYFSLASDPESKCLIVTSPFWEWTGAAAWLGQHFWLRWEYTQDKDFLRNRAYPVYKELGMFYEDYLVEDPRPESRHFGKLVTVPSYSPEAAFLYEDKDYSGVPFLELPFLTIGATMDFQLIHEVFSNLIEASKILDVDTDKREDWQYILDNIPPLQVGKYGQLQEWLEDYKDKEVNHRHISHLYAVFPGDQITIEDTPELAKAARVSLDRRLDPVEKIFPWPAARAWYSAVYARMGEAELAYDLIHGTLADSYLVNNNLFSVVIGDTFQIDGNGAAPAAVAEMLMQSHNGEIKLLPALPKAWANGHVKGLVARGGFEVDIEWHKGKLVRAVIKSRVGNDCNLRYGNKTIKLKTQKGKKYVFNNLLNMDTNHNGQRDPSEQGFRVKDPKTYLKAAPEDMQWWRDMKFGMFIHWGPVSLVGTEIAWSRAGHRPGTGGTGSIPVETYDNLYKKFNPVEFNAEQWVQTAKDAGMKYIVFVSKTHDGFCMFDTKLTDHKITNSPFKRDVAKELSLACQKSGLRFGFYYSPPDWYHPDFLTDNHDRYIKFMHAQLRELCTNYGKIDIIWFDGLRGTSEDWDSETMFRIIRKLQPHVIINDRAGLPADYETPEQTIGSFSMDRAWETCMTLGDQWAWKPNDNIKSLKQCIDTLVTAAGGDGNFLFNTGPMPTGKIEPRQAKRFRQMGQWLKKYGHSIYGTRGGPFMPGPWGASTRTGSIIYIHVLKWPKKSLELPTIDREILSAFVLTGGTVKVDQTVEGIIFDADKQARKSIDTIIALTLDGPAMTIEPISTVPQAITTGKKVTTSNIYRDMEKEYGPQNAIDASYSTRWATDDGLQKAWIEVDLDKPITFDRAVIKEACGELVQQFELQYKDGKSWKTFYHGSKIGETLDVEFAPVTAQIVRLNILDTVNGGPTIWEFLLY